MKQERNGRVDAAGACNELRSTTWGIRCLALLDNLEGGGGSENGSFLASAASAWGLHPPQHRTPQGRGPKVFLRLSIPPPPEPAWRRGANGDNARSQTPFIHHKEDIPDGQWTAHVLTFEHFFHFL